jgi:hypothetical protein
LAAAEAAGARGEPGNGIPPFKQAYRRAGRRGHVCEHQA